jgi:hypothetical protein
LVWYWHTVCDSDTVRQQITTLVLFDMVLIRPEDSQDNNKNITTCNCLMMRSNGPYAAVRSESLKGHVARILLFATVQLNYTLPTARRRCLARAGLRERCLLVVLLVETLLSNVGRPPAVARADFPMFEVAMEFLILDGGLQ